MNRYYLVEARVNLGYSQRKTARLSGISYQHYSKIEKGDRGRKVSFIIFSDIAKTLQIPLDELYYLEREYRNKEEFNAEFNNN